MCLTENCWIMTKIKNLYEYESNFRNRTLVYKELHLQKFNPSFVFSPRCHLVFGQLAPKSKSQNLMFLWTFLKIEQVNWCINFLKIPWLSSKLKCLSTTHDSLRFSPKTIDLLDFIEKFVNWVFPKVLYVLSMLLYCGCKFLEFWPKISMT